MGRWTSRLFLLGSAMFASVAPLSAQVSQEDDEWKLKETEGRRSLALLRSVGAPTTGSRSYDVTYYKLDLRVETNPTRISGSVTIGALSRSDSLDEITLDLLNSMTVDSVKMEAVLRPFLQSPESFDVQLGQARSSGTAFVLTVYYHGIPMASGLGSFASTTAPNGSPWIWTLSEPYGARDWWPCNDHPSDKADSLDVWITVPEPLKVGSQGVLEGVLSNGDGTKTYRWKHRYPIATYLVSLAIADYVEISYWFRHSPTDSMEVLNYMLPGSNPGSLPLSVEMLQIFSELFGPYPFLSEKYGHAQLERGVGAMEHQTMTSTSSTSEWIIAHELAHQWFGDMITLETWPHIWLNEGFATYGEVLYREQKYGAEAYEPAMSFTMLDAREATTPLYVSDTTNLGLLFSGSLVYSKGATVLHMLRHVIGDSLFFAAVKAYASDFGLIYGTATTEDFQRVCESLTGRNLEWFFQQWVYGERYPQYIYRWWSTPQGGGHLLALEISQSTGTANPTFFTMPIDIEILGPGMDTTIVVFNDRSTQSFSIAVPSKPTSVVVDPGYWILKSASGAKEPLRFELDQNFPNPFNATTTLRFTLGVRSRVLLEVYDVLGRRIVTLVDEVREAGFHVEQWSAVVPSGAYFARLQASALDGTGRDLAQTRAMMVVR